MEEVDHRDVLYGAGTLAALVSIAVFSSRPVLGVSPVTRAAMLLLASAWFIVLGYYSKDDRPRKVLYTVAAGTYVGLLYHLVITGMPPGYLFLVTAVTAIAAAGAARYLEDLSTSWGNREIYLTLVAAAFMLVLVVDITGADTQSSLLLDSHPRVEGDRVELGKLVVYNDFFLPRNLDPAEYYACYRNGEVLETRKLETGVPDLVGPQRVREFQVYFDADTPGLPGDFTGYNVTRSRNCSPPPGVVQVVQDS